LRFLIESVDSWFFLLFLFPRYVDSITGPEGAKNAAGETSSDRSDPFSQRVKHSKNAAGLSIEIATRAGSRFELRKRRQLFIRVHNQTLSVVAVRVNNPDRSPVGINR
jgi:hypothetical protein